MWSLRLLALEKKLDLLEKAVRNDHMWIQRMIMMLDLSDDKYPEMTGAMKDLDAADR